MFLWQTGWLWPDCMRQRRADWKDETDTRVGDTARKRDGGVERGSPASLCQGFPPSHPGSVNARLAQAHSWILTSPLSSCPHSTSPPPPPFFQPRQWIKEAVYTEQKNWAVPRRRETLPGDSCQQQQQWDALCVQSIRKQSRKQSVFLSALQTICR